MTLQRFGWLSSILSSAFFLFMASFSSDDWPKFTDRAAVFSLLAIAWKPQSPEEPSSDKQRD